MDKFQGKLFLWAKKHGRKNLPWRKKIITPYEVWVSEIMLQQTQVSRVISYYKNFLKKFPSLRSLAKTTWEEFLPYYRGLGYYRRGKNMIETAKILLKEYHGKFPKDISLLERLPGIGEYTARAILCFGYGEQYLAPDTNVKRVLGRFLQGSKHAIINIKLIESKFQIKDFRSLNAALMDFGNMVCTKRPKCQECPLKKECSYFRTLGKIESQSHGKKTNSFSKNTQVFLFLHKDHKEYYSPNPDQFEFFRLPIGISSREKIKKYFLEKYGLELAVRPPHKKIVLEKIPTLFVNAQILLGNHGFGVFKKEEVKTYAQDCLFSG